MSGRRDLPAWEAVVACLMGGDGQRVATSPVGLNGPLRWLLEGARPVPSETGGI